MEELRRLRQEAGLSQTQLARDSGVDRATINKIEQGKRSPSMATLESLARALGAEIGDFFPKAEAPLPLDFADSGALTEYLESVNGQLERLLADREDPNRVVESLVWDALRLAYNAPSWREDARSPLMQAWIALSASAVKLRNEVITHDADKPPAHHLELEGAELSAFDVGHILRASFEARAMDREETHT